MAELVEEYSELLLNKENLENDLQNALNLSELQRRRFRAIAQIAGLMNRGFPGSTKSTGQLKLVRLFYLMYLIDMNQAIDYFNRLIKK
jgi:ATP-dependent Lhr-like helicase